jgi:alkylation response protein AidB-like acyl-CoA dehydrogenase
VGRGRPARLPRRQHPGGLRRRRHGIVELAIVAEELAAAGCPLLFIVVSPAICGSVIGRSGTAEQKERWLPALASGTTKMAFAITEPDAGSNSHRLSTVARRDGSDWILAGRKTYISGVDEADAVLVVGRAEDARTGTLRPALAIVPTDAPGFEKTLIPVEITGPEKQFALFLDDVRLPADAMVGETADAALAALFAGSTRSGSPGPRSPTGSAGTRSTRRRRTRTPGRCGACRSAATRAWRTRSRTRRSRSSWPG